ncbi:MAG: GNAT family N-acetyltransferase, partial [Chloroflexota bacterium]
MIIRPERVDDYPAIANLHARAFHLRYSEASIVALQRHRSTFDPELSFVADDGGMIVGHALFNPHTIRLLDQDVSAVNLAPIAVEPGFQGRGIGTALIEEGHAASKTKGHRVSFLVGHPGYYPRFGYRMHAYGAASISMPALPAASEGMARRSPVEADVPALVRLWQEDQARVDFAVFPGHDLLDWLSPNPMIHAHVYTEGENGSIRGYARIHDSEPTKPRVFLARDAHAAAVIASSLVQEVEAESRSAIVLPLHPSARCAQGLPVPFPRPMAPAMAVSLASVLLDEYLQAVEA